MVLLLKTYKYHSQNRVRIILLMAIRSTTISLIITIITLLLSILMIVISIIILLILILKIAYINNDDHVAMVRVRIQNERWSFGSQQKRLVRCKCIARVMRSTIWYDLMSMLNRNNRINITIIDISSNSHINKNSNNNNKNIQMIIVM